MPLKEQHLRLSSGLSARVHIYMCLHTYMHTRTCVSLYTCTDMLHIRPYKHAHTYMCLPIYMHTHTHASIQACMHTYTCLYTNMHTRMCFPIYMHTRTHTSYIYAYIHVPPYTRACTHTRTIHTNTHKIFLTNHNKWH